MKALTWSSAATAEQIATALASAPALTSGSQACVRLGDKGSSVDLLHSLLYQLGYALGAPSHWSTGQPFDEYTKGAVEAYQYDKGLNSDGIVGPNTWRRLGQSGKSCGGGYSVSTPTGDGAAPLTGEGVPIHKKKWFLPVVATSVLGVVALIAFWPKKG